VPLMMLPVACESKALSEGAACPVARWHATAKLVLKTLFAGLSEIVGYIMVATAAHSFVVVIFVLDVCVKMVASRSWFQGPLHPVYTSMYLFLDDINPQIYYQVNSLLSFFATHHSLAAAICCCRRDPSILNADGHHF
jgi:hypothetical protein